MNQGKKKNSLGELESLIMEELWTRGSASVRDVLTEVRKKRTIAYTTVMTVMARLSAKGLLTRKLTQNGAYVYTATQDKALFFANTSRQIIHQLLSEYGDIAVSQFMEEITDSKRIDQLREELKKIS